MYSPRKPVRAVDIRLLFFATVILLTSHNGAFGATFASPNTRITTAGDKFDGVVQIAAAFEVGKWDFLRSHHVEIAIGPISSSSGNAAFVSIGPVWRTPLLRDRYFADIGIAPTLFSDSRHGERNLGGHFHFTSFVSVGMRLDRSSSLSLRIQHTSNGGIRDTNPGMDMLGLEFSYNFSE